MDRQILQHELSKRFRRFQPAIKNLGTLAYIGGVDGAIDVPDRPGFIYVSISNAPPIEVYNKRVPPVYGLPVIVGFDPNEPNLYQVLSGSTPSMDQDTGSGNNTIIYNIPVGPHATSHMYNGSDPAWLDVRQILNCRVGPYPAEIGQGAVSGSAVIEVQGGIYTLSGAVNELSYQILDISSHVPASGSTSRFVLISINAAGSIVAASGSVVSGLTPDLTYLPAVPSDELGLAYVRVYGGMTDTYEGEEYTDFLDLRTLLASPSVSGSIVGSVTPLSNATPQPLGAAAPGTSGSAARGDHVHAHGNLDGGLLHAQVTSGSPGFMPVLSGNPAQFFSGSGTWLTPISGSYAPASVPFLIVSGSVPGAVPNARYLQDGYNTRISDGGASGPLAVDLTVVRKRDIATVSGSGVENISDWDITYCDGPTANLELEPATGTGNQHTIVSGSSTVVTITAYSGDYINGLSALTIQNGATVTLADRSGSNWIIESQSSAATHDPVTLAANSGLIIPSGQVLAMGTPTGLTASTANVVSGSSHAHAVTGFLPLTGGTLTGSLVYQPPTTSAYVAYTLDTKTNHDTTNSVWNISGFAGANPYGTRKNSTIQIGYNQTGSGRVDTGDHAWFLQFENYYRPDVGNQLAEFHLDYVSPAGANVRPFHITYDVGTDVIATVNKAHTTYWVLPTDNTSAIIYTMGASLVASSAAYFIPVTYTLTSTSTAGVDVNAHYVTMSANPSGASLSVFSSLYAIVTTPVANSQALNGNVEALRFLVSHQGSGAMAVGSGARGEVTTSQGTITIANGFYAGVSTSGSGVIGTGRGMWVNSPGGNARVTTAQGIYIANQGAASITNAYGIYIADQNTATSLNYGIFSVNAQNYYALEYGAVSKTLTVHEGTASNNTLGISSNVMYGIQSNLSVYALSANSGTRYNYCFYGRNRWTANSTFTSTTLTGYVFYAESPSVLGAGTISLGANVGFYAANQGTVKAPNSYAFYVAAQSGSVTANYAFYSAGAGLNYLGDQLRIDGTADRVQLIVEGHSTQTTNLQEWKDSAAAVQFSLGLAGAVFNEGGVATCDFRVESDTEANMIFVDADANTDGSIYLGGTTNGIRIDKGGELTLIGTATVFDDLRVDMSAAKLGGSKDPGFSVFKTNGAGSQGVFLYWFDKSLEEEVYFSVQMPHSWDSTAVTPHVHWVPKTANAGGTQTVEWGLEYTWVNIDGTFGDTTIVYAKSAGSHTVAGKHTLTAFAAITPSSSQNGISSMMICRLFRNATDATDDTYDDDAGLLTFDLHYAINTMGSKTATAK